MLVLGSDKGPCGEGSDIDINGVTSVTVYMILCLALGGREGILFNSHTLYKESVINWGRQLGPCEVPPKDLVVCRERNESTTRTEQGDDLTRMK
jgi:hypothetical protein